MVVSTTPMPEVVPETPKSTEIQSLLEEDPKEPAETKEAPSTAMVCQEVEMSLEPTSPSPEMGNQTVVLDAASPTVVYTSEKQKATGTPEMEPPREAITIVSAEEDERLVLVEDFLSGKITIAHSQEHDADPTVTIAPEVLEVLASAWKSCLVIKALGMIIRFEIMQRKLKELWKPAGKMRVIDLPNGYYIIKFSDESDYMGVLTGRPWTVFGRYVVIKPWSPSFNPRTDVVHTTPAWIRFTDLLVILYEEKVLLQIASAVGHPIKVDQRTLNANRGRFARICIELDLTKPLIGAVIINGTCFLIGLHTICFGCGRFGHYQPACPQDPKNVAKRLEVEAFQAVAIVAGKQPVSKAWGTWMIPSRRGSPRTEEVITAPKGSTNPPARTEGQNISNGRFASLAVDEGDVADQKGGMMASQIPVGQSSTKDKGKILQKAEKMGKDKSKQGMTLTTVGKRERSRDGGDRKRIGSRADFQE
ncbi:LOW QUALITY PROTEIN: hypothetical protein V2J09_013225 [Rumex salicifolius]